MLECYIKLGWKGLPETNPLTYQACSMNMKCCEYDPRNCISAELTNGTNKLECYIKLGWKCLPVTNPLTYQACFMSMKCCEYEPRNCIQNTSFSSELTDGPNKLECYIKLGWKGLPITNTLIYYACFMSMKCCEYEPRNCIHNTSFSSELTNGPNRLECYIKLGWKSFPVTNTLTYQACSMNMKCCEYEPRNCIQNTSFSSEITNGPNKLECYIKLGWKSFPVTNTLTYQACLMNMKCSEYDPRNFISAELTNGTNKLECYNKLGWKGLPETNPLTYQACSMNMKCCEYEPRNCIQNTSFSSEITNGTNKLECYIKLGWKGLAVANTLTYQACLMNMKCCEYKPSNCIHNTSFSSVLTNGPNKLKCYIKLGWKGLPVTNTLTYQACLMNMKCCEYEPSNCIHSTSFSSEFTNGTNKLECYIKLGWKSFPVTNTLIYQACSMNMKYCEYDPKNCISAELTNGPNNLECYIKLGWKGLPVTNPLTYQACSMNMKCCEYDPRNCISAELINGPNKLECYIKLGWKGLPVTSALTYLACKHELL